MDPRLRAHIVGGWPSKPRRTTLLNHITSLNTIPNNESTADEFDDSKNHRNNTLTSQLTPDAPPESNVNDDINDYSKIYNYEFDVDTDSSKSYFSLDKLCEREVTFENNGHTSVKQDQMQEEFSRRREQLERDLAFERHQLQTKLEAVQTQK